MTTSRVPADVRARKPVAAKKTTKKAAKKTATKAAKKTSATSAAPVRAALAREEPTSTSTPRLRVRVFHRMPSATWKDLITFVQIDGDNVTLVGGGGVSVILRSKDGGKTFKPNRFRVGQGLRMLLVDGDNTWVCGQYGLLARAKKNGPFEKVDIGATQCMQTLMKTDGALWATGDSGAFRSTDDGETWQKVREVPGEVTRPQPSPHGVLLPSDQGRLYIWHEGHVRETALQASVPLWAAASTPTGTLLAVGGPNGGYGAGVILRSTDGGRTASSIPVGVDVAIENVAVTPSGRVFCVGPKGTILCSVDDGESFFPVPNPHKSAFLVGMTVVGERIYTSGINNAVLVVEEAGARAR